MTSRMVAAHSRFHVSVCSIIFFNSPSHNSKQTSSMNILQVTLAKKKKKKYSIPLLPPIALDFF